MNAYDPEILMRDGAPGEVCVTRKNELCSLILEIELASENLRDISAINCLVYVVLMSKDCQGSQLTFL